MGSAATECHTTVGLIQVQVSNNGEVQIVRRSGPKAIQNGVALREFVNAKFTNEKIVEVSTLEDND